MLDARFTVRLIIQGPFLTQSSNIGEYGVDAPVATKTITKEDGSTEQRCYIPGTLVKGKLKEAWSELKTAATAFHPADVHLLGLPTGNRNSPQIRWLPQRANLQFSDFIENKASYFGTSYRIRIDNDRGSVQKGAYQVLETRHRAGQQICFEGTVRWIASDESEVQRVKRDLEIGLRWVHSFGSQRTIGFGRLVSVAISRIPMEAIAAQTETTTGKEILALRIAPESSFCIGTRRTSDNLFESDTVIPGGVIKGCIVSTWLALLGKPQWQPITPDFDPQRRELCENFDRVRIMHAFPSADGRTRPVQPPFSRVRIVTPEPAWYDVALCDGPGLIREAVPAFAIDWKQPEVDETAAQFGFPDLKTELRVRTAIDSEKRRARDEDLFAYQMIVPGRTRWLSQVDLSGIERTVRPKVEQQLRSLLDRGLRALGKTKTFAAVEIVASHALSPKFPSLPEAVDGVWIVTLQTPAVLCDPWTLDEASGRECLRKAYNEAWRNLSGSALELVRYFSSEKLSGGNYLHHRFQSGKPYYPFLLTDAGSVFVLRANAGHDAAQQAIDSWLRTGLPLPDWAVERYMNGDPEKANYWQYCPYLPENGYGEIAVNLPGHLNDRPKKEEYDGVPEPL